MANGASLASTAKERAEQRRAESDQLAAQVLPPGTKGPNGQEVAVRDPMRDLMDRFEPEIARQVPGAFNVEAFTRLALTGLKTSKQARQLAQCTRPSLFTALLDAARLGLMPFTDEAAIVPFKDQATFIPMYQGYIKLFFNTGQVARVVRGLIHKNDEWALAYGDGGGFHHRPLLVDPDTGERPDRGPAILAYCYLMMRDGTRTEVDTMTRWEAEEIRDKYSRSYQNAEQLWKDTNGRKGRDSAWHTDFDKQWVKSVIRLHAKVAPKSTEIMTLLMMDNRDDTRPDVRAQAPPPPPMPKMTEADQGIDWGKDLAGNTIQGKVEDPDGWPEGTTPGPPPAAQGQAEPGQDAEPPPGGTEEDSEATELRRLVGKLGQRFKELDWKGDDFKERRRVLTGVLAIGNAKVPPLDLASPGQLTVRQAKIALATWDALAKAADEAGEPLAGRMQRLYDTAVAARTQAAGQEAHGGQDAAAGEGPEQ
jgi:recombination protein RecT